MVFLVVKGTQYPDEFMVERQLTDTLSDTAAATAAPPSPTTASIAPAIAHLLNKRHHVRLMLMSAQELATLLEDAQKRAATDTSDRAESTSSFLEEYNSLRDATHSRLKDTKACVRNDEFDQAEAQLRTLTAVLYPALCTHPDGTEAAIQQLYTQHESPDLDEETRLLVYHCRVVMDPEWKANEQVKESEAALWFCGKPMEGTLAKYAGRNEKSKIIVKVAPRQGPAPSGEPRMRYEDQRALYQQMCRRRETFKALGESELRDRVVQQARGGVRLTMSLGGGNSGGNDRAGGASMLPSGADGSPTLRTDGLRSIYARKDEREVPIT